MIVNNLWYSFLKSMIGMLQIEVCDSGKGFAADEQEEQIAADLRRFNGRDLIGEGIALLFFS